MARPGLVLLRVGRCSGPGSRTQVENGNKFGFQGFGTSKNVWHLGLICVRCLELQLCLESLVHNRGYLGFPSLLLQVGKKSHLAAEAEIKI